MSITNKVFLLGFAINILITSNVYSHGGMAPPVDVQNRDGTSHSGLENFLVLLKSGEYVPLKDFSKHHHESKTVSFNKSKNSYSFSPKLDWKKLKSEGNFLIYADQYDAHHLDKKRKSTLHVFQLSKLN